MTGNAMNIGLNDTVRVPSGHVGTVRFIGHTEFKKNVIFYGIHLKDSIGINNGTYDKRKYFKCPDKHGVFTVVKNLERVKKHSVLASSFFYDEKVSIINNVGRGLIKYIGLTKYDNYKNYFYVVLLNSNIKPTKMKDVISNEHILYDISGKNKYYFDAEPKKLIFVRQNQLKHINKAKKSDKKPTNRMRRAHTMVPKKKSKKRSNNKSGKVNNNKTNKIKTVKSSKQLKSKQLKISNSHSINIKNKKEKQNKQKQKQKQKQKKQKKQKIKKIREMRMIKSDLGKIRENHKLKKIEIKYSKTGQSNAGCDTPIADNKKKTKKRKNTKKRKKAKTPKTKPTNKYYEIINNYEKYEKYIDSKHYYYHKQFIDGNNSNNNSKMDDIKERDGPPSMVSYFSTRSRINQRKKRSIPMIPKVYTIRIDDRPLGFFIETKKLNSIIENENGEHVIKQVELVDNQNKFNKVNAYVSMIGNIELWENILIIGSQLLQINDLDITGNSFTKIFKILSSEPVPFDIKLAAPTNNSENESESLLQSPRLAPESEYIIDGPRGRGKTIDQTQFEKRKKFLLF